MTPEPDPAASLGYIRSRRGPDVVSFEGAAIPSPERLAEINETLRQMARERQAGQENGDL